MGILEMLEEAFGDFYGTEPEEIVAFRSLRQVEGAELRTCL